MKDGAMLREQQIEVEPLSLPRPSIVSTKESREVPGQAFFPKAEWQTSLHVTSAERLPNGQSRDAVFTGRPSKTHEELSPPSEDTQSSFAKN